MGSSLSSNCVRGRESIARAKRGIGVKQGRRAAPSCKTQPRTAARSAGAHDRAGSGLAGRSRAPVRRDLVPDQHGHEEQEHHGDAEVMVVRGEPDGHADAQHARQPDERCGGDDLQGQARPGRSRCPGRGRAVRALGHAASGHARARLMPRRFRRLRGRWAGVGPCKIRKAIVRARTMLHLASLRIPCTPAVPACAAAGLQDRGRERSRRGVARRHSSHHARHRVRWCPRRGRGGSPGMVAHVTTLRGARMGSHARRIRVWVKLHDHGSGGRFRHRRHHPGGQFPRGEGGRRGRIRRRLPRPARRVPRPRRHQVPQDPGADERGAAGCLPREVPRGGRAHVPALGGHHGGLPAPPRRRAQPARRALRALPCPGVARRRVARRHHHAAPRAGAFAARAAQGREDDAPHRRRAGEGPQVPGARRAGLHHPPRSRSRRTSSSPTSTAPRR